MYSRAERNLLAAYLTARAGLEFPANAAKEILPAASAEAILPSLYPCLPSLPPSELTSALQAITRLNAERNQVILYELRSVAALLNAHGIEPVVLKGAAYLLAGIYPDALGSRYLADVDLVIAEAQMATAHSAMLEAGYQPRTDDAMARFRHHHPPLRKAGLGVDIELHHALALGKVTRKLLSVDEVIAGSTLLMWQGVRVRIPSPEHLITHLILHSQIRHPYSERIWPPLRGLYDLVLLNAHYGPALDWAAIENRFCRAGQRATLYLHLLQAEETMGMARPLAISLTWAEKLRWGRRCLLNRWPGVRFVDPSYWCLAMISRRLRLLEAILQTKGGPWSALRMLLTIGFYRRLLEEIF